MPLEAARETKKKRTATRDILRVVTCQQEAATTRVRVPGTSRQTSIRAFRGDVDDDGDGASRAWFPCSCFAWWCSNLNSVARPLHRISPSHRRPLIRQPAVTRLRLV